MAVRLNKRQSEKSISAIQTTNTLRRLQEHVNGETELSSTQIAAARILLDKTIPNAPVTNVNVEAERIPDYVVHHAE